MRLLNVHSFQISEFFGENVPPYAILSHTWGEEEVSFQDMVEGRATKMKGYQKILGCCNQAHSDGFEYVWIDTCCIDKQSSSELSEAINSMYRWYQASWVCYAYLEDISLSFSSEHHSNFDFDLSSLSLKPQGSRQPVLAMGGLGSEHDSTSDDSGSEHDFDSTRPELDSSSEPDHTAPNDSSSFEYSRWFTRGWTLQELIAPPFVVFYSSDWTEIGTRNTLEDTIVGCTGISSDALRGGTLDNFSVAQKMSWASSRMTTRVEDEAYCLLGLFGVSMPLIYGEGRKAFRRLQEEIIRQSDDETIFAWEIPYDYVGNYSCNCADILRRHGYCPYHGPAHLLGQSPYVFRDCGSLRCYKAGREGPSVRSASPFAVTNKGVQIRLPMIKRQGLWPPLRLWTNESGHRHLFHDKEYTLAILNCNCELRLDYLIAFFVLETETNGIYRRYGPLVTVPISHIEEMAVERRILIQIASDEPTERQIPFKGHLVTVLPFPTTLLPVSFVTSLRSKSLGIENLYHEEDGTIKFRISVIGNNFLNIYSYGMAIEPAALVFKSVQGHTVILSLTLDRRDFTLSAAIGCVGGEADSVVPADNGRPWYFSKALLSFAQRILGTSITHMFGRDPDKPPLEVWAKTSRSKENSSVVTIYLVPR